LVHQGVVQIGNDQIGRRDVLRSDTQITLGSGGDGRRDSLPRRRRDGTCSTRASAPRAGCATLLAGCGWRACRAITSSRSIARFRSA
jgi:hypothetical protein